MSSGRSLRLVEKKIKYQWNAKRHCLKIHIKKACLNFRSQDCSVRQQKIAVLLVTFRYLLNRARIFLFNKRLTLSLVGKY